MSNKGLLACKECNLAKGCVYFYEEKGCPYSYEKVPMEDKKEINPFIIVFVIVLGFGFILIFSIIKKIIKTLKAIKEEYLKKEVKYE